MAMKDALIGYWKAADGQWYFHGVYRNSRIGMDGGEGYKTRAGVKRAIARAQAAFSAAPAKEVPNKRSITS